MKDAEPEEEEEVLDEEILNSATRDITARKRLLENDMRIMKSEFQRLTHEKATMNDKIKDNQDKIENNRYAPRPTSEVVVSYVSMLTSTDNCHISSETSSKYWTLM